MAATDFSGMFSAFDGTPSFTTLDNVKSQPIQTAVGTGLGEWTSNNAANQQDLDSFINAWNAGTPAATAQTNQEVGDIGNFYNGTVAGQLASQVAASSAANRAAGSQALAYATQGRNAAQLASGTGNSSYNTRLGLANANQIDVGNAQQAAAQTAANTKYLLGEQTALAGQRENLENNLAQRSLVPVTARNSTLSASLGNLGTLQNINNANNFYGLSQNQSIWDDLGKFSDASVSTAAALYGDVAGGMTGGMLGGMGGSTSGMGGSTSGMGGSTSGTASSGGGMSPLSEYFGTSNPGYSAAPTMAPYGGFYGDFGVAGTSVF